MGIWSKISPWFDKEYYGFTSIAILVSILSISTFITKDKIKSEDDLVKIEGKFSDYSFESGRRGSNMYYFWLNEYQCTFQIPANYLAFFNSNRFVMDINKNDNLELYITKNQLDNLNSEKKIFVQHIEKQRFVFLDKKNSIEMESGFGEFYFSIGCLIAGLLYYKIRTTIWKPKPKY